MATLDIERFDVPETSRSERMVELLRRRAVEQLEGRSVWCIVAAPTEVAAADKLERCLETVRETGVAPRRISVEPSQPLIGLLQRLDGMLRGVRTRIGAPAFGHIDEDTYSAGRQHADTLIPEDLQPGDVVVLHDPIAAALAPAIRERGAHTVWRASIGRWESNSTAAWRFLHRRRPDLDAYVTPWRPRKAGSPPGRAGIAAYICATRAVAAKEADVVIGEQRYGELVWPAVLADVVRDDRAERVGGALHARPSVPVR